MSDEIPEFTDEDLDKLVDEFVEHADWHGWMTIKARQWSRLLNLASRLRSERDGYKTALEKIAEPNVDEDLRFGDLCKIAKEALDG
jgi:hypothetical protein